MVIRPTEPADFPAIADLTNRFIRHTAIHFGDRDQTPEDFQTLWEATRDTYPWLTGELDGAFAGYAKASVWRDRAAYHRTAESAIYMAEHARGRGLGRTLYVALIDELRARGFHTVIGGATMPNDASVRLHESVGFEYVATFREVGRKFDRWHDVAFWQLML